MSGTAVYTVMPHTATPLPVALPAAVPAFSATGMAITGLGIAAVSVAIYLAVKDLKREHDESIAIFNARSDTYQNNIIEKNAVYSAQLASALESANVTYQTANQNAMEDFITHKLRSCMQRMMITPDAPNDLVSRLKQLQDDFNTTGETDEIAERIYQLSNEIFENTALSTHSISAEELLDEIEIVKQEIILLPAEMQNIMLESLAQYEKIADKQTRMALQGIKLLKERIYREITEIKKREAEREESRKLINEALACINAMQKQSLEIKYQQLAATYLNELQELILQTSNIAVIKDMYQKINNSYLECEELLQKLSDNEYVKIKLIETLLSMGMQVQMKEDGEEGIVAIIDSTVGMDFSLQNGQMKAEMIAINDEKTVMPDKVEEGCKITDAVMEKLAENGMEVHEKFRKSQKYEEGHKLRVVKVKTAGEEVTAHAEEKKYLKAGE